MKLTTHQNPMQSLRICQTTPWLIHTSAQCSAYYGTNFTSSSSKALHCSPLHINAQITALILILFLTLIKNYERVTYNLCSFQHPWNGPNIMRIIANICLHSGIWWGDCSSCVLIWKSLICHSAALRYSDGCMLQQICLKIKIGHEKYLNS